MNHQRKSFFGDFRHIVLINFLGCVTFVASLEVRREHSHVGVQEKSLYVISSEHYLVVTGE